ncbi:MAG: alpha-galactosidase [Lachnospiraceae bacterium]|nr:alpha-galactosidase [Lachnospiraceae bacterium]
MYTTKVTSEDMALARTVLYPWVMDPAALPIRFTLGGCVYRGIPEGCRTECGRIPDSRIMERTYSGMIPGTDLEVSAVCRVYMDHPVVEWTAYIRNTGSADSAVITDFYGMDGILPGEGPVITASNGDTCEEDLYTERHIDLTSEKVFSQHPDGGRGSDCAWPYSRVTCADKGYLLSIGWPGQWVSRYEIAESGFRFQAKQQDTRFFLHPGETVRSPRMTVMIHTGSEERGINLWRRFMIDHIVPRPDGDVPPPAVSLSNHGSGVEYTESSEEQQLQALQVFRKFGVPGEHWWIDAGWYPCADENGKNDWHQTGIPAADEKRYPRGLRPVQEKAAELGYDFLLWFEPERISLPHVAGLYPDHFILKLKDESALDAVRLTGACRALIENMGLLNLADESCVDWIVEKTDQMIKDFKVKVYRQDFNFPPLIWWRQNDEEDRQGITENLYIQGYLRFWDELLCRNPGMWINSVSSGGRRSDLESLSRSVSLHQSDFGYGLHPVHQAYLASSFLWQPYCGTFAMSWDDENGEYGGRSRLHNTFDNYMAHCALCPSMRISEEVLGLEKDTDEEPAGLRYYRIFRKIWETAAPYMICGDVYVLHPSDRTNRGYHAVQFHDEEKGSGFLQIIRNTKCPEGRITVHPRQIDTEAEYTLSSPESGRKMTISGSRLAQEGFSVSIPARSGVIWFYSVEKRF